MKTTKNKLVNLQASLNKKSRLRILKTFASIILIVLAALITIPTFAQNKKDSSARVKQNSEDTTDRRFHDDLLNHLVGNWDVSGIVHGRAGKQILEAEWVLNHQFLRIYQKSEENVPGINVPFEGFFFIGYDHIKKQYVGHLMSVFGSDGGNGVYGLHLGSRTDNEIKLVFKTSNPDVVGVQRYTWDPGSKSWHIVSRMVNAGKEGEPFLDLEATLAKPSSN